MLEHLQSPPAAPRRAVVMGARGFVGAAIDRHLRGQGIATLALGRTEIDLSASGAEERLAAQLRPDDALVFVSAVAPCRDVESLAKNLAMVRAVCAALTRSPVAHVVNISSDAVYPRDAETVSERTPAAPSDLHGAMHAAREAMLQAAVKAPLAILRPSLLYGAADPHNGYGPNRFRRLAAEGKDISLFGEGEEKRDHVSVDDVAALVALCLTHRSHGVLNVATGQARSFRAVAEMIAARHGNAIRVVGTPRQSAVVHRHFDVTDRIKAFPRFAPVPLEQGLEAVHAAVGGARG